MFFLPFVYLDYQCYYQYIHSSLLSVVLLPYALFYEFCEFQRGYICVSQTLYAVIYYYTRSASLEINLQFLSICLLILVATTTIWHKCYFMNFKIFTYLFTILSFGSCCYLNSKFGFLYRFSLLDLIVFLGCTNE